ncbi:MAG: NADP-dependent malic enzyme [Gemmatimonadales bacterium]|nr:NADP-dependent malic enzyme [Gemmatimonadales bacterium]
MTVRRQEALDYHAGGRPGKIQIAITKPCKTQRDLSLAYTPGVAEPCLDIQKNPDDAYRYTARGNLVAVVSNGTAVLGLGDIGALAGKPVMEGKGVLFKAFADVDVFDLEINAPTAQDCIRFCEMLEPTVGGINLEDIKAPECFEVEETLKKRLKIPVFHDDQHGTAIISGAALLNAAEIVGKRLEDLQVVFSGAGASAIATANHYVRLGVKLEHIILVDTKGVVHPERTDLNPYKAAFARDTNARTLGEAMKGADVFVGLSVAGIVSRDMVAGMAERPIVFALANPTPEIMPDEVRAARPDAIVATGRSDFPNQVNNVLGFPFIFRGALDVRARAVNDEMKMAATRALAALTREEVPEAVLLAYGLDHLHFGPDYLIPKPLDARVLLWVAPAVAEAAVKSGVARTTLDPVRYREQLEERFGASRALVRTLTARARRTLQRLVFPEGHDHRVLRAAHLLADEGVAKPILLGSRERIARAAAEAEVPLDALTIVDPATDAARERYAKGLWERRARKGVTEHQAIQLASRPDYFGSLMVALGDADALLYGIEQIYPDKLHAPLQVVGVTPLAGIAAGVIAVTIERDSYFLADTTLVEHPDARTVATIASQTAKLVRRFGLVPRVALLSFSNFGSYRTDDSTRMALAARILHDEEPDLEADGEMMAETALTPALLRGQYPFSRLKGQANVLIFPGVAAANIAYQLIKCLAGAQVIGPMIVGTAKPVHLLRRDSSVEDVVNMAVIAAVDAQERCR